MESIKPRLGRSAWLIVAMLIVIVLIAVAWQRVLFARPADSAALPLPPPPQINGLYLPDSLNPVVSPEQARGFGLRVASSIPDLISSSSTADVIVLDATVFDQLDAAWLGSMLREGKVIATLNVPFARLAALPGYRQPPAPLAYRQEWGGRPFFSFVRQWQDDRGALHLSTGSDYLNSSSDFFRRIYQITPAGIKASASDTPTKVPTQATR